MKYLDIRVQALDHIIDEHKEVKGQLEEATKFKMDMITSGETYHWDDTVKKHKELTASLSRISSTMARLQQRSPMDDKDVEDIARPITKPIMYRNRWRVIVLAREKPVLLAVELRDIFKSNKQVFKSLDPDKGRACARYMTDPRYEPMAMTWPKQALNEVPSYAMSFLWDAIVPRQQCLLKISTSQIWDLFVARAREMADIWVDGPSGSRYMYGIGRKPLGHDHQVCIVAGDTKKHTVLAYMFGPRGRYYVPADPSERLSINFFYRTRGTAKCRMGWSNGRTRSLFKTRPPRFQRVAYGWLRDYDELTVMSDKFPGAGIVGRTFNTY